MQRTLPHSPELAPVDAKERPRVAWTLGVSGVATGKSATTLLAPPHALTPQ